MATAAATAAAVQRYGRPGKKYIQLPLAFTWYGDFAGLGLYVLIAVGLTVL
jgi:hypothetical protein